MMAFGAKIKLSVNTSGASAFRSEIQKYVNTATASNPIKLKNFAVSMTVDQRKKIIRDLQTYLSGDTTLTLKIGKIDATGAVTKLRQQLQTMLSGLSITGLKEFLGETNIDKIVKDIDKAKESASQWAAQMCVVDDIQRKLGSTYKTALSGNQMIGNASQVNEITAAYTAWQVKVEELRDTKVALSAEELQSLQQEGIALQQKISLIQQEEIADKQTASTERKTAEDSIASSQQIISLRSQINRYILSNSKAYRAYADEFDNMTSNLQEESKLSVVDLNNIRTSFYKIKDSAKLANLEGKTFFDTLKKGWEKFGGWSIVTRSMMAALRVLKNMVTAVKEVDAAMTELYKVTNLTEAAYKRFANSASTISKSVGASLADTINATADFARLGYSLSDSTALAEAALVYKNVGDGIDDIDEASQSLISTIKAFGIESTNAISIVDKFNEVGNNFAISSEGIGIALQKSASSLSAANNTLEESIGLITGMNAVIQDPEKVGTALKTVSMYLRAAKTEAEEAGESTDGMASSVSELRNELLTLTKGKVDIMLDATTFKSTYQIMKELSSVWKDLADVDTANILELIGGKRNATAVTSLLTNFKDAENSLTSAKDAAGSAYAENAKYLDGISGKLSLMKASFESMSNTIISSKFIKTAVDWLTTVIDGVGWLAKNIGTFPTLIGAISIAFSAFGHTINTLSLVDGKFAFFGSSLDEITKRFNLARDAGVGFSSALKLVFSADIEKNITAISRYNSMSEKTIEFQNKYNGVLARSETPMAKYLKSLNGSKASLAGYNAYCKSAGIQTQTLGIKAKLGAVGVTILNAALQMMLTMGIGLLIQGLVTGISSLINYASKASEEANELAESTKESADNLSQEMASLDELVEKYKSLRSSEFVDADVRTEIRNLQEEIVKLTGNEVGNLDLVNGRLDDQLSKLKEAEKIKAQQAQDSAVAALNAAKTASSKAVGSSSGSFSHPAFGGWDYVGSRDKEAEEILKDAGYGMNAQTGGWFNNSTYISSYWSKNGEYITDAADKAEALKGMIEALESAAGYDYTESEVFTKLQLQYEEYLKYGENISDQAKNLLNSTISLQKYSSEVDKITVSSVDSYNEYKNALIKSVSDDDAISSAINSGALSIENIESAVNDLMATDFPEWYNEVNSSLDGSGTYTKKLSNLKDTITDLTKSYDILNTAKLEMENGGLSNNTIQSIIDVMDEGENYLDYLKFENGQIELNTQAWQERASSTILGDLDQIQKETDSILAQNEALKDKIKYAEEQRKIGSDGGIWSSQIAQYTKELEENNDKIKENQELLGMYGAIYDDIANSFVNVLDFTDMTGDLGSIENSVKSLVSAMSSLADGTALTKQELVKLALEYPKLLEASDLFTDGSISGQRSMLDNILQVYENEYDATIDTKIAELEAANTAFNDSINMEKEKANILSELKSEEVNNNAQYAAWLSEKLVAFNNIDGENYVTYQDGVLKVTEDTLNKIMQDESEKANLSAENVWKPQATTIAESYSKGGSAGLSALSTVGQRIAGWITGVKNKFLSLARTIASAITGKEYDDGATSTDIETYIDTDVGDVKFTGGTVTINGQTLDEWTSKQSEITASRIEALRSQIDTNLATINNLKQLKGFDLTSIYGSTSSTSSKKEIEEYIANIDEYYAALKRLADAQTLRENLEDELSHTDDPAAKIKLYDKLVNAYKEEAEAEKNLVNQRSKSIAANASALRKLGFQVEYNAKTNQFYIANLEHLNELTATSKGKYETLQEATNALRKDVEGLISTTEDLNDSNRDSIDNIEDLTYEIQDAAEEIIDCIEDVYKKQIDAYNDIIAKRKEAIESAKDEYEYEEDVANKVKEIADLQAKIDKLSLDNSREAQAQRNALLSELAEKQKDLNDTQSDYSYDKQVEALDKMAEEYESEKNSEIEILKQSIGTVQDLGTTIDERITNAWKNARKAVEEYGYSVAGLNGGYVTSVGAVPKYHTGGVVGGNATGKEEILALLEAGEIVLNDQKQESIYRIIDFQTELAKRLGVNIANTAPPLAELDTNYNLDNVSPSVVNSSTQTVFNPEFNIEIQHNGEMSDNDARRYGEEIADTAIAKLYNAFERKGINNHNGAKLKP